MGLRPVLAIFHDRRRHKRAIPFMLRGGAASDILGIDRQVPARRVCSGIAPTTSAIDTRVDGHARACYAAHMRIISKFHDYYDSVARDEAHDAAVWVRNPRVEHADGLGVVPLPWNVEAHGQHNGGICGERILDNGFGWRGPRRGRRGGVVRGFDGLAQAPTPVLKAIREVDETTGAREALLLIAGKAYPVFIMRGGFSEFATQRQDQATDTKVPQGRATLAFPAALSLPAHARGRVVGGTARDVLDEWRRRVREALMAIPEIAAGGETVTHLPGGNLDSFLDTAGQHISHGSCYDDEHDLKWRVYDATMAQAVAFDWTPVHLRFGSPTLMLARLPQAQRYGINLGGRPDLLTEITVDPCLDMLCFSSRVDAFTLFQEVSMFVDGVMPGHGHEMANLSDKSRVLKGGFDPRYGFRKRPQSS